MVCSEGRGVPFISTVRMLKAASMMDACPKGPSKTWFAVARVLCAGRGWQGVSSSGAAAGPRWERLRCCWGQSGTVPAGSKTGVSSHRLPKLRQSGEPAAPRCRHVG